MQNKNKLGVGKLLIYKSSDVATAGISAIVLSYLSLYCTDTLGINAAMVGTILLISAILMIRILYSVIPAIFLVIIGISAKAFAPLERKIPLWEREQQARTK